MALKLKDTVNPERLREFGFRLGREYFDKERWCGDGYCFEYMADWYHKFLTVDWDTNRFGEGFDEILYADDDLPVVQMMFCIGDTNNLYINCVPNGTYYIGGDELDVVTDTIYELVSAGVSREGVIWFAADLTSY